MAKLSENAELVAKDRYFFGCDEGWYNLSLRVGHNNAAMEQEPAKWGGLFAEIIFNQDFVPAGRILKNSGTVGKVSSLFNCYVIPFIDSIEGIGQFIMDSMITWSSGGGVGTDLSILRPKGAALKRKGGESSGSVSFLMAADAAADTIKTGGNRRAAGLAMLRVDHPDIEEFINCKSIDGKISNFNISVGITEEFLNAVENDTDYDLSFNNIFYKKLNAREIWNKMMANAVKFAEPGFLYLPNLKSNNSYYYAPIISTNPCGEVPLEPYGACNLGSIKLQNFISGSRTNWKKLGEVVKLAVRFLDNIIDVNNYVLPQFQVSATNGRRVGIGCMGVADYLFAKKIRYGSEQSISEIEKVYKFIRDTAYYASVELAKEKGPFVNFDPIKYCKGDFIRTLPVKLRREIKRYGIRNVTLLAQAPSGTISLVADSTSGIEPLFCKAYERKDAVSDRFYIHPLYKEILESGGAVPDWFVDSYDISVDEHFEMQSIVQKYIDGAVSKTINMPNGTTENDVSEMLLDYIREIKGTTIYVDGSRKGQILIPISEDEVRNAIKSSDSNADVDTVKCANGKCEL